MATLSERIRDTCESIWVRHPHAYLGDFFALAAELDGKVAVTPITVEVEPGWYHTVLTDVHGSGSSPEDAMAEFVDRLRR